MGEPSATARRSEPFGSVGFRRFDDRSPSMIGPAATPDSALPDSLGGRDAKVSPSEVAKGDC